MHSAYSKLPIQTIDTGNDAIWISIASSSNPSAAKKKCTWKVANICRMSHIVTVGNQFLKNYASPFCKDVRIIPTVVDTNHKHNRLKKHEEDLPLCIGWTGTYTNFYHLQKLAPVFKDLKNKYHSRFLIIADKDPGFEDIEYDYKKWHFDTEIDDLLEIKIGIMPLEITAIELSKCGFKAIQYMSLGIPATVSPVGVNTTVVQHGRNGFWANTSREWYDSFSILLNDPALRTQMGVEARQHILTNFSVDSSKELFFDIFSPE